MWQPRIAWANDRTRKVIDFVLWAVVAAAVFVEASHLARHAAIYFSQPIIGDERIYFALGRGWLNGLTIYRDLFDAKPPGIFILAALSLQLSGDHSFYLWLQLGLLILFSPLVSLFTCRMVRPELGRARRYAVAASVVLGLAISVQTVHRSEGYQTEGFALVFATLPALLLGLPLTSRWSILLDLCAGASLAVATILKEPFGPAGLIGILIFCRSRRDLTRVVRILLVAAVAWLGMLALTGSFVEYFSRYVPEMLTGRSVSAQVYTDYELQRRFRIPAPLWVRSLDGYRVFTRLPLSWAGALLPVFFFGCLTMWGPIRSNDRRPRAVITSALILAVALFSGPHVRLLHQLILGLHTLGEPVPWGHPILLRQYALAFGPAVALAISYTVIPRRWRPSWLTCALAVTAFIVFLVVSALAALTGDYGTRYLVYAFPPFVALAIYCLSSAANGNRTTLCILIGTLIILNSLMPSRYDYPAIAKSLAVEAEDTEWQRRAASSVDRLLSKCGVERYLMGDLNLDALAAYTKHSPYEVFYGIRRALGNEFGSSGTPNASLAAKLMNDLQSTPIIIFSRQAEPSSIPSPVRSVLADFTTIPPPCAVDVLPISRLRVYFRRSFSGSAP